MKRVRGTTEAVDAAARELRREATPSEELLWQKLRNRQVRGAKFRRQYAIGPLICDFCCPEHRLVIEVDGTVHDQPEQAGRDAARTMHLESYGYTVLRFRADAVESNLDRVIQDFEAKLHTRKGFSNPLPELGEGGEPKRAG